MGVETKKVSAYSGEVVRVSSAKTRVVVFWRQVKHPLYRKYCKFKRKYIVHDELDQTQVGDIVQFAPCRPISGSKRWKIVSSGE